MVTCNFGDTLFILKLYYNEKTPAERIDWHISLFEECGDVINELSFIGKTSDVKKNKNGYDVTYLSIQE